MNQETKPSNPTAFPTLTYSKNTGEMNGHEEGMTLRDYFASKAVTGVCNNNASKTTDWIARKSYEIADAMLKQREL